MSSFRAPALRACALAAGITIMGGASAQAAEQVSATKTAERSCHQRYLGATKSTDVTRTTAPATGLVRARLSGKGDWDLARLRRQLAALRRRLGRLRAPTSSRRASSARARSCACRRAASAAARRAPKLSVDFASKIASASGAQAVQLVDVEHAHPRDKQRLQGLDLDLTEHGDPNSVEVVLHGTADERKLRDAGFTYARRIADLDARAVEGRQGGRRQVRSVEDAQDAQLPSGRNAVPPPRRLRTSR